MKEEIKEQQNAATPQVENKNETCCCGENNNHGACKHHHHHEKHHEQHEKVEQDSKALEAANTKIAELTAKLATTDKEKQEGKRKWVWIENEQEGWIPVCVVSI